MRPHDTTNQMRMPASVVRKSRSSISSTRAQIAQSIVVRMTSNAGMPARLEDSMKQRSGRSFRALGLALLAAAGLIALVRVHAQAQPNGPTFEVASVKPNKSGDGRVMIGMQPGGRFTTTNVPLRALIRQAYQLQDFQIVEGPDWINNERFDIVAKAEGDVAPAPLGTVGPMQLMLRNLLAERFKLVAHGDKRDMPMYAMVLARSDGKLGPQLRPSTVDCAAMFGRGRGAPPPAAPPPGERPQCGMRIGPGTMAGGGFPISQFAT